MRTSSKGNGASTRAPRLEPNTKPSIEHAPAKFSYALKQWTVERRATGWFVSPTTSSVTGNKPEWRGPFETIETAMLAIARALAVELADRHTRSVEFHKIDRSDPLYGLKPTTRLDGRGGSVA
jgi:hypothetical protein